jgi:hypothetical protein
LNGSRSQRSGAEKFRRGVGNEKRAEAQDRGEEHRRFRGIKFVRRFEPAAASGVNGEEKVAINRVLSNRTEGELNQLQD